MTPNSTDTRLNRLQAALASLDLDAMLTNYGPMFQYVTGLEKPVSYDVGRAHGDWITALVVPVEDEPVLILRPSWLREYTEGTPFAVRALEGDEDADAFFASQLHSLGLDGKRIGLPKTVWGQTVVSMRNALPNATLVAMDDRTVDRIRTIKDADEIALLEEVARITDETFASVIQQLKPGMMDRDLVIEIDYQFKKHGGDAFSFMPTVVLDGHGQRWARNWTDRTPPQPITHGMSVAFDMGVVYHGYCSDFGRSAFIGEPKPDALAAWKSITKAIQAGFEVMGDSRITPAEVHDFFVEQVTEDGFRDQFSWYALGHAIGLDVHENPWMLPEWTEPIKAGMCFALEPKIGIPGRFYVRCEDVLVVEQERSRPLTRYPYDPIVIE